MAKFRIEGLKELEAALSDMPKATAKATIRRALKKAARPIEAAAENLAPVRTGRLQKSVETSAKLSKRQAAIQRRLTGSGPKLTIDGFRSEPSKSVEIYVGAGVVPQAHLQEFGSANNPPQPFLRPAWDANKRKALASIKDDLASEIAKTAARVARRRAKATAAL